MANPMPEVKKKADNETFGIKKQNLVTKPMAPVHSVEVFALFEERTRLRRNSLGRESF